MDVNKTGKGKWEMRNGKWRTGNGQRATGNRKLMWEEKVPRVLLEWVQQRIFGDGRMWAPASIGQLSMEVRLSVLFEFHFCF